MPQRPFLSVEAYATFDEVRVCVIGQLAFLSKRLPGGQKSRMSLSTNNTPTHTHRRSGPNLYKQP